MGGSDAAMLDFPYQVSLARNSIYPRRSSHFCGGSIISVDWVLTAAHCVEGTYPEDVLVRVGNEVLNKGSEHTVSEVIVHSGFSKDIELDYDIALLKVDQPFEISPKVKPIPLNKHPLKTSAIIVISGWGTTEEGGDLPTYLQKVEVPMVPHWECKWLYGKEKITKHMFCGGRAGKDSCQGDSGGPVVSNGLLIGVVSWGEGCARAGYPGVYTNVYELRSWILEKSGV